MPRTTTDTRERILQAAWDLFFRKGYQATSVDEIVEESGLSKPTVYAHFTTKENLCVEYLKERRKQEIPMLRAAIRAARSPRDRFLATIRFVREGLISNGYRGCGFFNLVSEIPDPGNPVVEEARDFMERFRDEIRESVRELQESDPRYADIDPERVTSSYYMIVCGAIMMAQSLREAWVLDQAVEEVERLLDSLR